MFELTPTQFSTVLPLFEDFPQKVLPYAVLEGINPGRVWTDARQDSQTALLWTPVGYYFLAGEPKEMEIPLIQQALTETLIPASLAAGENCLILIPSTVAWKAFLPLLLPRREIIEIYRRPFAFDPAKFLALGDWRSRLPPGLRMQPVDDILAAQLDILASWTSVEDFLSNGMGFALVDENEIASACTSVFASRERVEIDVRTSEAYRRRGLARLTASALIDTCLQQGKLPNWECFWENEPSIALAEKLGFSPLPVYPVYFWEEPTSAS